MTMPVATIIRPLKATDLDQVLAIEASVHIAPWDQATFEICFKEGYLAWVAETEGIILGFVILSQRLDECHVLNLAVAMPYQRQGLGRHLMQAVLEMAVAEKVKVMYLEVRQSNTRAIALYQGLGFQRVGERRDYYPTVVGKEDAYVYAKVLDSNMA